MTSWKILRITGDNLYEHISNASAKEYLSQDHRHKMTGLEEAPNLVKDFSFTAREKGPESLSPAQENCYGHPPGN